MNLRNNVFMTIPIIFDYNKLELTTDEEKQNFINQFLKDVVNTPLTTKQNNIDLGDRDIVIGVITGGEQAEDYSVKLFALSIINIIPEFTQIPTTDSNAILPLAEKIKINDIYLDFEPDINQKYLDLVQLQKNISQKLETIIKDKDE